MPELILILISFAFGILCIGHLRRYDVHEREPLFAMAAVTIWGGFVSIVCSLFLYRIIQENGVSLTDGFPFSYLYVGYVEELAKLLALVSCWPIIRREMDEPTDGLIYMACVALGFSLIENYFYALANPGINLLIAIRLVICTPMHIAFSMFMGLAFFWAVRRKGGWGLLFGAYIIAGIYHALYDTFVSYPLLLPGLYLILHSAYAWMYRLLGYTAARSPFRQTLTQWITSETAPAIEPGYPCLECTNNAPKPTYRRGRIRIQRCEECGSYLCSPHALYQLVHHYGSLFGSLRRRIHHLPHQGKHTRTLITGNRIDRRKHVACFQLDEFNEVLEATSRELAEKMERKWWFPAGNIK
ncbi:MAG: PrsW family intramembrane metalloprotease [Pontiellaceae bacterium]|nr:PrsW family intramembrane metalloprotease [Pontiellaceae bacterium]MBN2783968.1 PrsW family intramembrane metalloprotease [Pontiellaceae bacterium]